MNSEELKIFSNGFNTISAILDEPRLTPEKAKQRGIEIIARIIANSHKGIISDCKSNPNSLSKDNIEDLSDAFRKFLYNNFHHV